MASQDKRKPKRASKITCATARRYMAAASIYASGKPISSIKLLKMTVHVDGCTTCKKAYDDLEAAAGREMSNSDPRQSALALTAASSDRAPRATDRSQQLISQHDT